MTEQIPVDTFQGRAFLSERGPVTFWYQVQPEKNQQEQKENNGAFQLGCLKLVVLPLLSMDDTHT